MRTFGGAVLLLILTASLPAAQAPVTDPLAIARILAAKYPAQPIMSYIPALSWANSIRLSEITGEMQWRENPRRTWHPSSRIDH